MKNKCPYLGRKVSSHRYYGFICNVSALPSTRGWLDGWTKEERAAYMEKNGCERGGCTCWFREKLGK